MQNNKTLSRLRAPRAKMTMSGMNSEFQPEQENKPEFGLRRLAVTTLPVVVLMALSFGYGYSQNQPGTDQ